MPKKQRSEGDAKPPPPSKPPPAASQQPAPARSNPDVELRRVFSNDPTLVSLDWSTTVGSSLAVVGDGSVGLLAEALSKGVNTHLRALDLRGCGGVGDVAARKLCVALPSCALVRVALARTRVSADTRREVQRLCVRNQAGADAAVMRRMPPEGLAQVISSMQSQDAEAAAEMRGDGPGVAELHRQRQEEQEAHAATKTALAAQAEQLIAAQAELAEAKTTIATAQPQVEQHQLDELLSAMETVENENDEHEVTIDELREELAEAKAATKVAEAKLAAVSSKPPPPSAPPPEPAAAPEDDDDDVDEDEDDDAARFNADADDNDDDDEDDEDEDVAGRDEDEGEDGELPALPEPEPEPQPGAADDGDADGDAIPQAEEAVEEEGTSTLAVAVAGERVGDGEVQVGTAAPEAEGAEKEGAAVVPAAAEAEGEPIVLTHRSTAQLVAAAADEAQAVQEELDVKSGEGDADAAAGDEPQKQQVSTHASSHLILNGVSEDRF